MLSVAENTALSRNRRDIASGEAEAHQKMIRFVADPSGWIVADLAERLPGRGVWLRSEKQVVERSLKPAFFSRSLRQKVKVHDDLVERLPIMLRQRVLDHLGLARRAGQLTLGFEQVQARLRDGSARLLVSASDASEDGKRKLFGLAKAAETGCEIADFFGREELSRAVGREGIVHLAVENGKLATTMIRDLQRLDGLSGSTQKDRVIATGRAAPRRNRMAD